MPYVQRDDEEHIVGIYANLQPGFAEEWLDDAALWEPPPTEAQILAAQSLKLQGLTQLSAAQKTALNNRIGTINDAIEFEEATPAELAELPVRQAQLTEWKRYAILLGRVTAQPGWPATVDWPVQPAAGMDLTVSAATPLSA